MSALAFDWLVQHSITSKYRCCVDDWRANWGGSPSYLEDTKRCVYGSIQTLIPQRRRRTSVAWYWAADFLIVTLLAFSQSSNSISQSYKLETVLIAHCHIITIYSCR